MKEFLYSAYKIIPWVVGWTLAQALTKYRGSYRVSTLLLIVSFWELFWKLWSNVNRIPYQHVGSFAPTHRFYIYTQAIRFSVWCNNWNEVTNQEEHTFFFLCGVWPEIFMPRWKLNESLSIFRKLMNVESVILDTTLLQYTIQMQVDSLFIHNIIYLCFFI